MCCYTSRANCRVLADMRVMLAWPFARRQRFGAKKFVNLIEAYAAHFCIRDCTHLPSLCGADVLLRNG